MKIVTQTVIARTAAVFAAVALSVTAVQAAAVLTAKNGMTLYVFDKDEGGVPSCYKECAKMWPAYMGNKGDKLSQGWTLVKRTGGDMQWAYDAKPVYFYKEDAKKGDMMGEGVGSAWHVIKE